MERRKIHNNLTIDWNITRGGVPEDFSGRDVQVQLRHVYGEVVPITWTIQGNVIHIVFFAHDQKRTGVYMLVCTENAGTAEMAEVDHCDAVELVLHSEDEGGEPCSNIEVSPVVLSSDLSVGINGPSAYDIAVKYGYQGTEEEWIAEYNAAVAAANAAAQTANGAAEGAQKAADGAKVATTQATTAAKDCNDAAAAIDTRLTGIENAIGVADEKINQILEG